MSAMPRDLPDPADRSDRSDHRDAPRRLHPSGGYRNTCSFQTSTLIYDATWWFCEKFLDSHSRTVDQMVQAARSGRQNIAEGSRASATSSQTELRLLNVARASLEELLLDYEDYLRHRHHPQWAPNAPEALAVRQVPQRHRGDPVDPKDRSDLSAITDAQRWTLYAPWLEHADPAVRANAAICLIHQANYLLGQQISALERVFVEGGGYSEQLAVARLAARDRTHHEGETDTLPACPLCGKPMVVRTIKQGKKAGSRFLGCTAYPACKGARELEAPA